MHKMSCKHLKDYKSKHGLKTFETIHGFFVFHPNLTDTYHQVLATCFDCETYCSNRILACMHCIYLGCFVKHIGEHVRHSSHSLYVELSNGHLYCSNCKDYIYDADIEEISEKQRLIAFRLSGDNGWSSCPAYNGPTRYLPWRPSQADAKVLQQHSNRLKLEPTSNVGIRGMVNLGSTCYMNCIMQAFLHTPMLRDYFFTDNHRCYSRKTKDCLFCHFGRLFQKYYTDDISTLSLHEILYLVWQKDPILSGYEEKDAHEFFMSALNLLHQHSSSSHSTPSIIDLIFHGKLQSDIVCQSCANVSTKIDPFSDISLDIPDSGPQAHADLSQCLLHFTRAEVLESSSIRCSTCQTYQESTKQLTFKTLPVVIVIHLKRFEHINGKRKKKSMYVSFPMELDMSRFTSNLRNQAHLPSSTNSDNRYTLYAVVVHVSDSLDTGHYLVYIRHTKDTWYKCTDVKVVPAETSEVLASEGYLLFYHKTVLSYK
ncbi:hypothetical protein O3M35_004669 [Rhynocoris fuscipes]|uniref:ubiquitinyl hydrolase 1 n=1 Tax=Rhynocoris fuscipes TaxID=488301 RepID=A0AAW1CH94_9HEMI